MILTGIDERAHLSPTLKIWVLSGGAVSVLRIEPAKGDLVSRVHLHCDHMMLSHAHPSLQVIAVVHQNPRLKHVRRKVCWICVNILEETRKLARRGSRNNVVARQ